MAGQNLPMSDKIATLVGHFVWPIFCCNIWPYHVQIKFGFFTRYSFECTFVFMSNQNGALVGHTSFQGKNIICSPAFGSGFFLIVLSWLRSVVTGFLLLSFRQITCFFTMWRISLLVWISCLTTLSNGNNIHCNVVVINEHIAVIGCSNTADSNGLLTLLLTPLIFSNLILV